MTINEMIDCMETIYHQVRTEKDTNNYSELLELTGEIYHCLLYDLECDYPECQLSPPPTGSFEF